MGEERKQAKLWVAGESRFSVIVAVIFKQQ